MNKKFFLFCIVILFSLSLVSCKKEESDSVNTIEEKYFTFYTGEECEQDTNNNIPFLVMVENSPASRPQSGLSQADIIYETSAEGGIPRFMALFHSNSPSIIGPVRSVRPYYISIANENGLPFAHCGGSSDALEDIKRDSSIMSINEVSEEKYFWRDSSRKAPHNLYTSSSKIRDFILNSNWSVSGKSFNNFDSSYYNNDTFNNCANLKITINKNYNTSYIYNNGLYTKYMDGVESVDTAYEEPLEFSNVIIQKTKINLGSDGLHLDMNLIGEGDGIILSQGKVIDIRWKKSSELSKTVLYDMNDKEIPLSPGKTIWHIVDIDTKIDY